jgi:hypothetical protein
MRRGFLKPHLIAHVDRGQWVISAYAPWTHYTNIAEREYHGVVGCGLGDLIRTMRRLATEEIRYKADWLNLQGKR